MAEFYLVRHGQASFGKANYDQLSPLGHQQSEWLGEYFAQRDIHFDTVIRGEMVRHAETADGIGRGLNRQLAHHIDRGLNEFDFNAVVDSYLSRYPDQTPDKHAPKATFYRLLKQAMQAWSTDQLDHEQLPETWHMFERRVKQALDNICDQHANSPVLVVSSGGAMSMILKQVLGFDSQTVIDINLQTRNASFSHFYFSHQRRVQMSTFNSVPHLDMPDRPGAVTYS